MEFFGNLEIYLQEIMRNVAASLMVPVMIILVCLILFSVYSIGALIAEYVTERRHFKANMPRDIKAIKDATYAGLPAVIEETGLLRRQKEALQMIVANMGLPEDDLFALAKAEVSATDARYRRKVSRTDLVTKIAPMMGLHAHPLGSRHRGDGAGRGQPALQFAARGFRRHGRRPYRWRRVHGGLFDSQTVVCELPGRDGIADDVRARESRASAFRRRDPPIRRRHPRESGRITVGRCQACEEKGR